MESIVIVSDTYVTLKLSANIFDLVAAQELEVTLYDQKNAGIQSVIVNLKDVAQITSEAGQFLEAMHNDFYNSGRSLVFAEPSESVLKKIKQEQLHLIINIIPTMTEAEEIISSEMLERDLMND